MLFSVLERIWDAAEGRGGEGGWGWEQRRLAYGHLRVKERHALRGFTDEKRGMPRNRFARPTPSCEYILLMGNSLTVVCYAPQVATTWLREVWFVWFARKYTWENII